MSTDKPQTMSLDQFEDKLGDLLNEAFAGGLSYASAICVMELSLMSLHDEVQAAQETGTAPLLANNRTGGEVP